MGKKENTEKLAFTFEAEKAGSVQICVNSNSADDIEYVFEIQTGVDTKDYDNLITKQNMRPAEAQATKVIDMVRQLRDELTNLVKSEEALKE